MLHNDAILQTAKDKAMEALEAEFGSLDEEDIDPFETVQADLDSDADVDV